MSATKTVVHPVTKQTFVLVECQFCGGKGKFWDQYEKRWYPCMTCEGHGCRTIEHTEKVVPHPHANDIPYYGNKPLGDKAFA
jgi:DnaJ-class molecular chaperone